MTGRDEGEKKIISLNIFYKGWWTKWRPTFAHLRDDGHFLTQVMEADFWRQNAVDVDIPLRLCQSEQCRDQRTLPSTGATHDTNLRERSCSAEHESCQNKRGRKVAQPFLEGETWLSSCGGPAGCRHCRRSWLGQRSPSLYWANQVEDVFGFPMVLHSPAHCTQSLAPLTSSKDNCKVLSTATSIFKCKREACGENFYFL